jgi:hypothetical protein
LRSAFPCDVRIVEQADERTDGAIIAERSQTPQSEGARARLWMSRISQVHLEHDDSFGRMEVDQTNEQHEWRVDTAGVPQQKVE